MSELSTQLTAYLVSERLPCVVAFHAANELGVTARELSTVANDADVRISRCQLGLFGFEEFGEKRFSGCVAVIPSELRDALTEGSTSKAIPCLAAWRIADDLAIPRILVGVAANEMGIRITHCQLGCFGSSAMSELQ
ncbi:MAG: hypothetical protein V3T03_07370 [Candidatus Bipolaricaulota bacterium]